MGRGWVAYIYIYEIHKYRERERDIYISISISLYIYTYSDSVVVDPIWDLQRYLHFYSIASLLNIPYSINSRMTGDF